MSFWDKVVSVAMSAKCMTGFHVGEFRPIDGRPKCNLEKTCPDCEKHLTKTQHKFNSWSFIYEGKCDSKRVCEYCKLEENSVRHDWSNVKERCQVHKVCKCCNQIEFVREEHGPWFAGVALPNGKQIFSCSGCGKQKERDFDPNVRRIN